MGRPTKPLALELDAFVQAVSDEIHRREGKGATELPTARTVRYYQAQGCLTAPERDGRLAVYGDRQFLEMLAIRTFQRAGVSLKEIKSQLVQATDEKLEQLTDARSGRRDAIATALDFTNLSATERKEELARVRGMVKDVADGSMGGMRNIVKRGQNLDAFQVGQRIQDVSVVIHGFNPFRFS